MSDAEIVRNALGVAWSMPDAVLEHTDPRFKWWDGPLREAIGAAKPALDRLESQNQALQERVTRLRVARDVLDEAATRPASAGEWEDAHNEFMDAVNNLLPEAAQETDPTEDEAERVVRLAMSGDEDAAQQVVRAWRSVYGDPTLRPDYAFRATQETDPE